jgi:hypothetical protein
VSQTRTMGKGEHIDAPMQARIFAAQRVKFAFFALAAPHPRMPSTCVSEGRINRPQQVHADPRSQHVGRRGQPQRENTPAWGYCFCGVRWKNLVQKTERGSGLLY